MGLILRKVSEGGGVTKGQWTFVTLHKKLNASIVFPQERLPGQVTSESRYWAPFKIHLEHYQIYV
jgi:hypothetical protein